ncbi:HIT-like domain,Scavenger mRNA decapping enzyme, N-terminal,Scavenger mRNA decapping enzyme DcpS/DCS2 [Cinara cedri]|uniref:m7GpppX diphosphatase n=1 Tax=Cinara cedri TaxID=506608 RepID=A0A5E4MJR5_9HEMI|nr:HIT-like domain,Scavenger mRNA decapping enzyme, N-terminal,Scavenger mRNA decapping enzyme DcpS/DCS2 [Cinara cedri]
MDHSQNLDKFNLKQILMNDTQRKIIAVEGNFNGSQEPAVIVMEKYAFDEAFVLNICNVNTKLTKNIENDVYKSFSCVPPYNDKISSNKIDIIYPATAKHILKFTSQPIYLVQETEEIYQTITLPHILENSFSLQWVYNCLEYKSEKESIKYDTASENAKDDENIGFLLLPDLKWSGKIDELYLLAVVKKRNIKSLRDLTANHLPLLKNILNKGSAAIYKLFGIHLSQLRIFVHYQPSFYHFHVHFTYLMHSPPGINVEKAHLLTTIINNIEMQSNYYQKASLSYVIKESDPLFSIFEEKDILHKAKVFDEKKNV